ncbi:MAG: hypothetical protein WCF18_05045 [Chthoniobacteraceae bacterium]
MNRATMSAKSRRRTPARQSGSAVLAALAILAVTLVLVGAALTEARNRFRTSHHSSRWSQAEHAAEAGAELALMTAQKGSWTTDGWPSAPGAPGAAAIETTNTLSTGVLATGPVSAAVAVDQVTISGVDWLRIRSTGKADVSGGAVAGLDPQDVLLRKLSLRQDRTNGSSVGAAPRATRTLEILAQPINRSPFKRAILLEKRITMGGGLVDSFDSSDPAKSTGSLYDLAKHQSNGDLAINDTEGASDLGGNFIYGDLDYSGPAPVGTANVQGAITSPFSEPPAPVVAPSWVTFNPTPTVINTSVSLTGGPKSAPARYKVSSVTVGGGNVMTLAPHAVGVESYIEVWVTGNFTTAGTGYILQQPGVHVIYHVEGDLTVSGSAFDNQSNLAASNIINVVSPPVGVTQLVTVSGSGTFIGAINAPGAAFTITGDANFSGAMIGKTMVISGNAGIHYDEALSKADVGLPPAYRVASWVEAVR